MNLRQLVYHLLFPKKNVSFKSGELLLFVTEQPNPEQMGGSTSDDAFFKAVTNQLSGPTQMGEADPVINALKNPALRRRSMLSPANAPVLNTIHLTVNELNDAQLTKTVQALNARFSANDTTAKAAAAAVTADPTIQGASLNWLSSPAQGSQQTGGGPGGKPVPMNTSVALQRVGEDQLNAQNFIAHHAPVREQDVGSQAVDIIILDTAPPLHVLAAGLHRYGLSQPNPASYPLTTLMGTNQQFSLALSNAGDFLTVKGNPVPGSNIRFRVSYNLMRQADERLLMDALSDYEVGTTVRGHDYKMYDHGLFIAGRLCNLLDKSGVQFNIHLVQVLSDYGVGTLESFTRGLDWGLNNPDRTPGAPAVVNCSLMLMSPRPIIYPQPGWWQRLWGAPPPYLVQLSQNEALLRSTYQSLQNTLDSYHANDILMTAASGNDSVPSARQKASFPAAFYNVMGIGANDRSGIANYSNEPDSPPPDGIYQTGGGIDIDGFSLDDLGGIYLGSFPPRPGQPFTPNTSGWAGWSGTSFATPSATARLANLLAGRISTAQAESIVRQNP
jgi:hypothetical protein